MEEKKKAFSIPDLQKELLEIETKAIKIKEMINFLCEMEGEQPLYQDFQTSMAIRTELKGDEYHGRPQATVITEILENRKNKGLGPASLDELYNEMMAGGHQFTGRTAPIQKRGLAIAMSKNPKFYKLPNEKLGLKSWYPVAKESEKPKKGKRRKRKHLVEKTTKQEETTPYAEKLKDKQSQQQEGAEVIVRRGRGRPKKEEPKE